MPAKKKSLTESKLFNEVVMVLCMGAALFVLLSLASYHPTDISLNSASLGGLNGEVKNLTGRGGAYLSDILFQLLGGAAYLLPVYGVIYGVGRFKGIDRSHRVIRTGAALLFLVSVAVALRLQGETLLIPGATIPSGGISGGLLADLLLQYFSMTGALVISATTLLVSLMVAARFSLVTLVMDIRGRVHKDRGAAPGAVVDEDEPVVPEELPPLHEPAIIEKKPAEAVTRTTLEPTQEAFSFDSRGGTYHLPPSQLLNEPVRNERKVPKDDLIARSQLLEKKLLDFGIEGRVTQVSPGPVITMYEFEPAPGVKVNRIVGLSDDLALSMRSPAEVRVSPLPGKAAVGIEVPNPTRETILLREILASPSFQDGKSKLMLALGKDIMGVPVCSDLARMPHLLVAGTTGSGKSVGVSSMIVSILYNATPAEVKFLMIDPKMVELALFDGIPHLIAPVITDMKRAADALRKVIAEMEQRYSLFASHGVRNIEGYNKTITGAREVREGMGAGASDDEGHSDPLPYIVVIIDELADLMVVAAKDVEDSIARLAAKARAAGIHLIIATQRPSVDVITGVIKANLPTRISYKVSSDIDSKVILDQRGGKQLLGNGDLLFLPPGTSKLVRIHGPFISDEEVRRVTDFIRQQGQPNYQPFELLKSPVPEAGEAGDDHDRDEMYQRAVELVTTTGQASISMLQRRLKIGYPRAGRIIEMMEEDGVVGPADGSRPRDVLARRYE